MIREHELTYKHDHNCSTPGKVVIIRNKVNEASNTWTWDGPKCGDLQGIELQLIRWRILDVIEDREIKRPGD